MLKDLRDVCTDTDVEKAKSLIEPRNARQYDLMGCLLRRSADTITRMRRPAVFTRST